MADRACLGQPGGSRDVKPRSRDTIEPSLELVSSITLRDMIGRCRKGTLRRGEGPRESLAYYTYRSRLKPRLGKSANT